MREEGPKRRVSQQYSLSLSCSTWFQLAARASRAPDLCPTSRFLHETQASGAAKAHVGVLLVYVVVVLGFFRVCVCVCSWLETYRVGLLLQVLCSCELALVSSGHGGGFGSLSEEIIDRDYTIARRRQDREESDRGGCSCVTCLGKRMEAEGNLGNQAPELSV